MSGSTKGDLLDRLAAIDAYTLADAARRRKVGHVVDRLRSVTGSVRFTGRALTARIAYDPDRIIPLSEYGIGPLLDRVGPGDVLVLDGGGLPLTAIGDLAVAMLRRQGAAAAVVNARVRDVEAIDAMAFPVFALDAGITTLAGHARIVDIGESLDLYSAGIDNGDVIAGCRGGLVIVPWQAAEAIVDDAVSIAASDQRVMDGIEAGERLADLWRAHKNRT